MMEFVEIDLPLPAVEPPVLAYPTIMESWGILGWYFLVALVVGTPCYLVLSKGLHISQTVSLLALIIIVNMALLFFLRWKAGPRWVRLQLTGHEQLWLYAVLPVMVMALAMVLSLQKFLYLPSWAEKTFEKAAQVPLVATVVIVVLAPVLEELLFRGVILQGLLRRYRPWVAIGQSTLLFAIIHVNPAQSVNALFIGLLFGWLYYRTRSLWLCMASHFLFNSVAFGSRFLKTWLQPSSTGRHGHASELPWLHYAGFVLLGTLVLAVILWCIQRTTANNVLEMSTAEANLNKV